MGIAPFEPLSDPMYSSADLLILNTAVHVLTLKPYLFFIWEIHFHHQLVVSEKHVNLDMSILIHIIITFVFCITWSILRNADPRLQFWYVVAMPTGLMTHLPSSYCY